MRKTNDPKIELHLHLEGGAPPSLIQQIAKEKNVDISSIFSEDGNYLFRDFTHFLSVYEAATSVLTSPKDFYRLTKAVLEQSSQNGVTYTETFLSPDFCGSADVIAWRDYLAAIEEAATEAKKDWGITMQGIVTCIRHFGPKKARNAALCAAETTGDFIVGFGMAGAETVGKQGDYVYSFDLAREVKKKIQKSNLDKIEGMILMNHGIFTFDDDARSSYEKMIRLVSRAERFIKKKMQISISKNYKTS